MLAPLFALWRKDRPWIVFFAVAGLLTALGAVLFAGSVEVMLFDREIAKATHWWALAGGVVLGAFASLFDELLATRELLWQRPLSSLQIAASRLLAVAAVLLTWQMSIPVVLACCLPFAEAEGLTLALGGWLEQQAAVAVAWPCAMAALFAGSLPLGPLSRLLVAGASGYLGLLVVDQADLWFGNRDCVAYFVACLLVAALFASLALAAPAQRRDKDRGLATYVPCITRWGISGICSVAAAVVVTSWEAVWIRALHRQFPRPFVGSGAVALRSLTFLDGQIASIAVDHEHRPIGDPKILNPHKRDDWVEADWDAKFPELHRDIVFETPRWLQRVPRSNASSGSTVRLSMDGGVWIQRRTSGSRHRFELLARPSGVAFTRRAMILGRDEPSPDRPTVIGEPGAAEVWIHDGKSSALVITPLPAEDRLLLVQGGYLSNDWLNSAEFGEWKKLASAQERQGIAMDPKWIRAAFGVEITKVQGTKACYAVVGSSLLPLPQWASIVQSESTSHEDPLVFRRTAAATSDHGAFAHEFQPRTFKERSAAAFAIGCSSLRPPLLQVLAHMAPANARPGWLFDGLTVDGRRSWLVLLQCAIAGLLAYVARRWLVRHGIPANAWTWQIALFGVPAVLLFVYFERPRRVVAREVAPPPPLRIGALSAGVAAP